MQRLKHQNPARLLVGSVRDALAPPGWLDRISPCSLRADSVAGLTGAAIVLPQAVAFAAIAGLPPQYGFYTAIVPAIVAAWAGSSLHAVTGPATAIAVLIFGALQGGFTPGSADWIAAAIALSLAVGVIQLACGLARLGALVDFVSHSVMLGFVAGAAVLIALSQLKHILGVELPRPDHLLDFLPALVRALPDANPAALAVAGISLGTGALMRWWRPRSPVFLIALAAGTAAGWAIGPHDMQQIGRISAALPAPALPDWSILSTPGLPSAALAIALVGLLEAMSISQGIALRSGQQIDANREFTGQGLANVAGGFFQCFPAATSFTRSGVNYEAGAQTPLSTVFSALLLVLVLAVAGPLLAEVPVPAMAGVILLVAWNLPDRRKLAHILHTSPAESWIAGVTCLTALFVDLEFSIYVGVLLSLALFLKKTAKPFVGIGAPDPSTPRKTFRPAVLNGLTECPQLVISRIDGPLYFGSVSFIRREFRRIERERPSQRNMILVLLGVGELDLSGAELLIEEAERRRARGGAMAIHTKTPSMIAALDRYGVSPLLLNGGAYHSKGDAIATIVPQLDAVVCATCPARIFHECAAQAHATDKNCAGVRDAPRAV